MTDLRIEPLTDTTWEPLVALFREGGDPRWCYCQFWRLRSRDFAALKVPELRERLHEQALAATPGSGATRGSGATPASGVAPASGLVALERGPDEIDRAVGWVGLGPRITFERIVRSKVIPTIDDRPVWSIVCFVVSASARGRGVGTALLAGAIRYAAEWGAVGLEAYPLDLEPGQRIDPAAAYTGTLTMFRRAGFRVVADRASDPSSSKRRVVVRLDLGPAGGRDAAASGGAATA